MWERYAQPGAGTSAGGVRTAAAGWRRRRILLGAPLPATSLSSGPWGPVPAHRWLPLACLALVACTTHDLPDLVILHGRVMDPASGLDALRNVAIRDGRIVEISERSLSGRDSLDARGLVVAPGFIDLHQHAHDSVAYRVEALDGTTTALELEGGTADVDHWYAERAGRSLIHHGVSVGHEPVRMVVMQDPGTTTPTGAAKLRAATDEELAGIAGRIDRGLDRGAVAVGMLIEFTPAATPWEVVEVFRAAARHDAAVHVHMRVLDEPLWFLEMEEVIGAAAATGAAAHIVHLQSSVGEDTPRGLELIRGARSRGLDITTEIYPYTASMSPIEAADNDDWATWPDRKFARLEWALTGERLTRESFGRYRALGGMIVDHNNPEEVVTAAVADPLPMVSSDGLLAAGVGHPRVAGTFARVLGHYVRDVRALSLMDALRKITIEPARRLERRVPGMAAKGRVQVGADADLVLFDPATILDRATYREPTLPPVGIPHVLVAGVQVVRDGVVQAGVSPGRAIRAPIAGPPDGVRDARP